MQKHLLNYSLSMWYASTECLCPNNRQRGTLVNNVFWQELCRLLGIDTECLSPITHRLDGKTKEL